MSSDEDFEALPDQSGAPAVVLLTPQQVVPDPPDWMQISWPRRSAHYHRDLKEAIGKEFLAEDTAHQAIYKNFKRSSRKDAKHVRICKHESTTTETDLFG